MLPRDGAAGVRTTLSVTAATVTVAISVFVLKAVDPPLVVVLAVPPAAPLVVSHAQ